MIASLIAAGVVALPGGWYAQDNLSPLTGARSFIAGIDSSNELVNSIGRPARATLTFGCAEGVRGVAIVWPTYVGTPGADVHWRFDQGKIELDGFQAAGNGLTLGNRHRAARQIMEGAENAKQLVVRVRAFRSTQDAVFDMSGAPAALQAVKAACPQ